jgi:hypothetical protein
MATGAANIPFALLEAPTDRRRITDDLNAEAHVTGLL